MTLVELLVEVEVSGPQTKLADVVAASVVVVVGVGTFHPNRQSMIGWGGERKFTYRRANCGPEGTDNQRAASTVKGADRGDGRAEDCACGIQRQLEDWL